MSNRSKSLPVVSATPRNKASDSNGVGVGVGGSGGVVVVAGKRRSASNNKHRRDSSTSSSSMATVGTSNVASIDPLLRDGDVFYRTVSVRPSLPDVEPEVSLTFIRPSDAAVSPGIPEKGFHGGNAAKEKVRSSVETRLSPDKRSSINSLMSGGSGGASTEGLSTSPISAPSTAREDHREKLQTTSSTVISGPGNVTDLSKKRQITGWPEFSEADINNEKWEIVVKAKAEKQTKGAPVAQQVQPFFDDPEGKCELPLCLKVAAWKRPKDFLSDKVPVIVDMNEGINSFDLVPSNEVVHRSELMRWITSQINALWHQSELNKTPEGNQVPPVPAVPDPNNIQESIYTHQWRPWEHIYSMTKVGKGPNWPLYNPCGKYAVRLYWMGCWRKMIVDDTMPFDEEENLLLPSTTRSHELWPMLLTKALLKIVALDSGSGRTSSEYGDFSPVHCLRGWLSEIIPLEPEYMEKAWNLLKVALPEFKLPEIPPSVEGGKVRESADKPKETNSISVVKESKSERDHEKPATEKGDAKPGARESKVAKGNQKSKKDKGDKEDKDKLKEKLVVIEEQPLPEHPEVMIFVSYHGLPKQPTKVTMLSVMADASERLRQHGLSHSYPHPVLLTKTRSCPLVPPTPPAKTEAWKEVRYWKKKQQTTISSEPVEPSPEKPIRSIHLVSPFLNHNVTPIEIPTETHRSVSALERRSTQTGQPNMDAIAENEDPPADGRDSRTQKQPKELAKIAEETAKQTEAVAAKQDKQETKEKAEKPDKLERKSKKSRADAPKELVPLESSLPPPSPKTSEKRATSSKLSKRDTVKHSEKEKQDSKISISSKLGGVDEVSSVTNDQEPGADSASEPKQEAPSSSPRTDFWMDFDTMFKCFTTLYIYHKPATYPFNYPETKVSVQSTAVAEKTDKTKVEKKSQLGASILLAQPIDDKSTANNFLFVDSLQPIEIVVSFSVISFWSDGNQYSMAKEESKMTIPALPAPSLAVKPGKDKTDRDSKIGDASATSESSVIGDQTAQAVGVVESLPKGPVPPGLIYAETYSWKRVVAGETRLRLRTTGTRASLLTLPPGRHVLRFFVSSPLGHYVHLCSTTNFIFGDEEKVMAELTKESCRFADNALKGLLSLGRCIQHFSDVEKHEVAKKEYLVCNCLYSKDKAIPSMKEHYKAYLEALYAMLKSLFSSPDTMHLLTSEMCFAWRVFCFDCISLNPLNLPAGGTTSRPATAITNSDRASSTGATKKPTTKKNPVASKLEFWKNKEITTDEKDSAALIQRTWRGYFVRKVRNARFPGNEDNSKVHDQLMKAWSALEQNMEVYSLLLFRTMFRQNPALMNKYSFSEDEWNRIAYSDYSGMYPEHGPNSWFLIFRDVFYVSEEMLCVPKLTTSTPHCFLRVIDNDSGKEIPQIFFKVMPHVYKKNKAGYTFVVEAMTSNDPIPAGRWRMRMIGSHNPLPSPTRKELNTSFNVQELRDYYVPDNSNVIFRYAVRVIDDHLVTLQMSVSKADIYIRLEILDNDEEVANAEGKGGAVIPSFIFRRNIRSNSAQADDILRSRSSSRSSTRAGAKSPSSTALQSSSSHKGVPPSAGRNSRASKQSGISGTLLDLDTETAVKTHKYIIKATVLRNGWPLSPSQWVFVQSLKDNERNETAAASETKDSPTTPVKSEKSTAKAKTPKTKPGKDKDKEKANVITSAQFDVTKPHWTLRIVSDGHLPDGLDVKKDTERADAVKAMKKAWEEAEPGRAAKAKQSRLQYLGSHLVKAEDLDEGDRDRPEVSMDDEGLLSTIPPKKNKPTEFVPPLDLTPWIRQTTDKPRDLDLVLPERELERKQEIEAFQATRKEVEEWRERDCQWRNKAKIDQMALFERRQIERDEYRAKLHESRLSIRQQFLEKERQLQEELTAKEAALQAERDKNDPKPSKPQKKEKSKSPSAKKKMNK